MEDFEGLTHFCEQAELEVSIPHIKMKRLHFFILPFHFQSPNGTVSSEIYGCLLAVYLLKNEL